jgi:uncharacterized protein
MRLTGNELRMTIFVDQDDTWHHKPLYHEIVHRAHLAGMSGASVFRGVEGFGASSLIHTSRLLSLAEDLPVAIMIVDTPERVRAFQSQLDEVVTEGLVVVDEVEVVRYVEHDSNSRTATAQGSQPATDRRDRHIAAEVSRRAGDVKGRIT